MSCAQFWWWIFHTYSYRRLSEMEMLNDCNVHKYLPVCCHFSSPSKWIGGVALPYLDTARPRPNAAPAQKHQREYAAPRHVIPYNLLADTMATSSCRRADVTIHFAKWIFSAAARTDIETERGSRFPLDEQKETHVNAHTKNANTPSAPHIHGCLLLGKDTRQRNIIDR